MIIINSLKMFVVNLLKISYFIIRPKLQNFIHYSVIHIEISGLGINDIKSLLNSTFYFVASDRTLSATA